MGIDVGDGGRKCLDVVREGVIRVGQPSVQIADAVVRLVFEVERVRVLDQTGSDGQGKFRLEVSDEAVDKRGRQGYRDPGEAITEEHVRLSVHDGLDQSAI